MLNDAIYRRQEWFPAELRAPMVAAWESDVRLALSDVERSISSRDFDDALEREGLAGAQLAFKLSGFNAAWYPWSSEVERELRPRRGFWRPLRTLARRGNRLLAFFKAALDWANLILESIGKAIPVVPAGVVSEFKKGVEASVRAGEGRRGSRWRRFLGFAE